MTVYEIAALVTFLVLVALPTLRSSNVIGTVWLSLFWPVGWFGIGYQWFKVRVFKRPFRCTSELEILGFMLAALTLAVLCRGFLQLRVF